MRRVFGWAGLILTASCGGGSMSPTASMPTATLPAGAYTATLSTASATTCSNGICTTVTICVGPATGPSTASFPVTLARDGDQATVAPADATDSFRMTLTLSGAAVTGDVSGTAVATSGATVTASGTLIGVVSSAQAGLVQGQLTGDLTITGASCSGIAKSWALTAR